MVPAGASPFVRAERRDGVVWITLDRPEKRNAITFAMADAIVGLVDDAAADEDTRVVVLRGEGTAFTTGVDLDDHAAEQSPRDKDLETDRADIHRAAARWHRLWTCPKPVLVKAHGWCAAWGLEIAMHADVVLATDDCRFFFPSVRNGSGLPDTALVLHQIGVQWAKRLLLSGEIIDGRTAARIGLVSESFDTEDALDAALGALAHRIAVLPPALVAQSKAVINERVELGGRAALQAFTEQANALARRDPEVATFGEILQRDGRAAAIAWREERLR